ncbi:hypothetical protein FRB91_005976 [Serendipita sp. 411]|nr:hypothetical protein FRC18_001280 [Serendipita sp. 400]KAG8840523.1 hypothetical protein FRB91_005976 [Serendipita sp. 411]KAG8849618.1 hypothetical protein FRC20_002274 [Serendipita sp. 405]
MPSGRTAHPGQDAGAEDRYALERDGGRPKGLKAYRIEVNLARCNGPIVNNS